MNNEKIVFKVDVTKIPKEKILERHYTNKAGHEVVAREIEFEAIPTKETRKISEGDTWELWKTHFVTIRQTKEERANRVKGTIVGDGLMFLQKNTKTVQFANEDGTVDKTDIPYPEGDSENLAF